jgi:hypothetical protein
VINVIHSVAENSFRWQGWKKLFDEEAWCIWHFFHGGVSVLGSSDKKRDDLIVFYWMCPASRPSRSSVETPNLLPPVSTAHCWVFVTKVHTKPDMWVLTSMAKQW